MLKIASKILDEGDTVRLIYKEDDTPKLRTDFSIDQLGDFIRELQGVANQASIARQNAGKPATTAPQSKSKTFEVWSVHLQPAQSGKYVTLQVSAKDGTSASLRFPTVLASQLADDLQSETQVTGQAGTKH